MEAKPQAKGTDGRKSYREGDDLFLQGDAGGDLYFIESGVVQIYQLRDGETIHLAEMTKGEIIGVMTCLTSDKRMASARAKTPVVCKKVPHANIRKVVLALPNWMKIVLKEFTLRLAEMNRHYSDAVVRMKKLEATQLTFVYTGAQLAAAFGAVAELVAIPSESTKVVVVEDLLGRLERVLNLQRPQLDRVFTTLLEAGLLKQEIEPDKKRTITRLDNALKLEYFAQFVRESRHGSTKKLVRAKFTHKETRVLSALVKFAARLEMDLEKTCRLKCRDLEASLERSTGVKFDREALERAKTLKLLALEDSPDGEQVVMKPSHLGRTVACIEAVRRLTVLDEAAVGARERAAA